MKRLLFILAILSIASCNQGHNANNISYSQNILPTKSIQTYSDGQIYGGTFQYKGNKISKSIDINNSYYNLYHYSGDLITRIDQFNEENKILGSLHFEYDSKNRLIKETSINGIEINYTFLSDEIIESTSELEHKTIFVANNRIIKEELLSGLIIYEYDTKHNSFTNVIGFDKLYYSHEFANIGSFYNVTNRIKDNLYTGFKTTSTFTYNEHDYPVKENYIRKDDKNKIVDKFTVVYHYNK